MTRRLFAIAGLAAVLAAAAPAQDKKDDPKPGKKPTVPETFRAYLAADARFTPKGTMPGVRKGWTVDASTKVKADDRDPRDRTGKMHCLVCEYGPAPVVAVFVRSDLKGLDATSGVAQLAQGLEVLIPKYRGDKLAAFMMFLQLEGEYQAEANDDTRDDLAAQVRGLAVAANATYVPFGLAPKQSKEIAEWGVGENAQVVVVFYDRMRVERRWSFDADPTPAQVKEVLDAVEQHLDPTKK